MEGRSGRARSGLALLFAAVFLSVTTENLPTGLLPPMSRDLGVPPGRLGLVVTGYAVMVAVFAAPLATLTTRLPRRRLVCLALAGYAVSCLALAASPTFWWAVAARLVGGTVHGVFWAMVAGYAGRLVPAPRSGRAIALVTSGGTVGILAGVPGGTSLGVAIGWRPAFAVVGAAALALAGLGARLLPDLPGATGPRGPGLAAVARTPGLPRVLAFTALSMLGFFTFITYIAPFLLHAGLTERQVGPALFGYGAAELAGLGLAGTLIDRRLPAVLLGGAAALTLALATLALVAGAGRPLVLSVTALSGVALGALPLATQVAVLRVAPAPVADRASALNASAFNTGIAGGALLGGVTLTHAGPGAVPAAAAVCTALGTASMLIGRGRGRRPAPLAISS